MGESGRETDARAIAFPWRLAVALALIAATAACRSQGDAPGTGGGVSTEAEADIDAPASNVTAHDPVETTTAPAGEASGPLAIPAPIAPLPVDATPVQLEPITYAAGFSVEGRPLDVSVLGQPVRGENVVLYIGAIHGDEPAGETLLRMLTDHLSRHPEDLAGRCAAILARANPDGVEGDRRSNARGVDLNRNFPSTNFMASAEHGSSPLSEPETQAVFSLIHSFEPVAVISVHQPIGAVDFDGPARALAERIAAATDLEVQTLGARSGSLGSYAGVDNQIPTVTLECRKQDHLLPSSELWERYRASLLVPLADPN